MGISQLLPPNHLRNRRILSVVGVARWYHEVAATLVVDEVDADLADAVEAEGMRCVVTPTVMADDVVAGSLARTCLVAAS